MLIVTITRSGNTITVTDGTLTRESCCDNSSAAAGLEAHLRSNPVLAAQWLQRDILTDPTPAGHTDNRSAPAAYKPIIAQSSVNYRALASEFIDG